MVADFYILYFNEFKVVIGLGVELLGAEHVPRALVDPVPVAHLRALGARGRPVYVLVRVVCLPVEANRARSRLLVVDALDIRSMVDGQRYRSGSPVDCAEFVPRTYEQLQRGVRVELVPDLDRVREHRLPVDELAGRLRYPRGARRDEGTLDPPCEVLG